MDSLTYPAGPRAAALCFLFTMLLLNAGCGTRDSEDVGDPFGGDGDTSVPGDGDSGDGDGDATDGELDAGNDGDGGADDDAGTGTGTLGGAVCITLDDFGTEGCECSRGGTCVSPLTCEAGTCICPPGIRGCACGADDACDAESICYEGRCVCPPGELGCACLGSNTCEPGLACSPGGVCLNGMDAGG